MTKPELKFNSDGHFRILMMSDFHGKPEYNPKLKAGIEALVDYAKPDFVMLGGDECCGVSEDVFRAYINDVLEPVTKRSIPFGHVFGNHDSEWNMTNPQLQKIYDEFELNCSEAGPEDVSGTGNYVLPIYSADGEDVKYHLWALDSHSESKRDFVRDFGLDPNTRFKLPIHFGDDNDQACPYIDQVIWYYDESLRREEEAGHKIPALMFMHVPLIEMCLIYRNPEKTGFIGHKREGVACSQMNSGLFMACLERGDVKGIFFGHEHLNDFQGQYCGITLAYDSCVGYDMSAHDDLRGGRIIDIWEDGRMETRHVKLMELMGESAMRRLDFFEGGDKYYIRDLDD